MRHQKAGKKLNRTGSHRDAMFRNMVTSLIEHGRIRTTDAKAKELRRWADRMVTLAKRGDLHARRQAMSIIRNKVTVHKLFEEASERFGSRAGGYTRIIKLGRRAGDGASVSLVELVRPDEKKTRKKKKAKAAKKTDVKPKTGVSTKVKAAKPKAAKSADKAPAEAAEGSTSTEAKAKAKADSKGDPDAVKETSEATKEPEQESTGPDTTAQQETKEPPEGGREEEKGGTDT